MTGTDTANRSGTGVRLQLDTVSFGPEGAAELDGNRRLVFVPRDQISQVELAHTTAVANGHEEALGGTGANPRRYRRLAFQHARDQVELTKFLDAVRASFGYL